MYPEDCLYSKEHEWVRIDGDSCTLGITSFAQDELGEIVFVELPETNDTFEAHDDNVESVGHGSADLCLPTRLEVSQPQSRCQVANQSHDGTKDNPLQE